MHSLTGEFRYSLDDKGRLSIPSRFRHWNDGNPECTFVVTKIAQEYLVAFPEPEWEVLAQKLLKLPQFNKQARQLVRAVSRRSVALKTDKQGRILIPKELLDHANIQKEAVIIGALNCLEIWSPQNLSQKDSEGPEFDDNFMDSISNIFT